MSNKQKLELTFVGKEWVNRNQNHEAAVLDFKEFFNKHRYKMSECDTYKIENVNHLIEVN
jgi:hypothetical protein